MKWRRAACFVVYESVTEIRLYSRVSALFVRAIFQTAWKYILLLTAACRMQMKSFVSFHQDSASCSALMPINLSHSINHTQNCIYNNYIFQLTKWQIFTLLLLLSVVLLWFSCEMTLMRRLKKNKWREKKNQTNNNIRLVKPDCMMDDLMSL